MKIIDHFRGTYRIYPNLMKENRRMLTCNRLDLQTLGSQPIMPKNLPGHWWNWCDNTFCGAICGQCIHFLISFDAYVDMDFLDCYIMFKPCYEVYNGRYEKFVSVVVLEGETSYVIVNEIHDV